MQNSLYWEGKKSIVYKRNSLFHCKNWKWKEPNSFGKRGWYQIGALLGSTVFTPLVIEILPGLDINLL